MDTEKLNQIYQEIATTVIEIIPEEWEKIYIYSEIQEDVSKVTFYYYSKEKDIPIHVIKIPEIFDIDEDVIDQQRYKLYDYFEELWNEFIKTGQDPWTSLTMYLDNSGEFKIDFEYDDYSHLDDYEKSIIWKYRYLTITPEDEDDKQFLEEYLKSLEANEE